MAAKKLSGEDNESITEFHHSVNMTSTELAKWLKTEESRSVGQKSSESTESTGHESGRNIVHLLGKNKSEYTDGDVHEMKRIVSYIHRHMAQKPSGDITETRWRYSLMNWGHDPEKKQKSS